MIAATRPFDPENSEKWRRLLACRRVIGAAYWAFPRDFARNPDAAVAALSEKLFLVIAIIEGRRVDFFPFDDDPILDPGELREDIGFLLGASSEALPIPSAPIFAELINHLAFVTMRRLNLFEQLARGFFPSAQPPDSRELFDQFSRKHDELAALSSFEVCRIVGIEQPSELRN